MHLVWTVWLGQETDNWEHDFVMSSVVWTGIAFLLLVQSVEIHEFTFGLLSDYLCYLKLFIKNVLHHNAVMYFDAISSFDKYSCFCLKKPFLQRWILELSPKHMGYHVQRNCSVCLGFFITWSNILIQNVTRNLSWNQPVKIS